MSQPIHTLQILGVLVLCNQAFTKAADYLQHPICETSCRPHYFSSQCALRTRTTCLADDLCVWNEQTGNKNKHDIHTFNAILEDIHCESLVEEFTEAAKINPTAVDVDAQNPCSAVCSDCQQVLEQWVLGAADEHQHQNISLGSFIHDIGDCGDCQTCQKNPSKFFADMHEYKGKSREEIGLLCRTDKKRDGFCSTRCSTLATNECWKDSQFCQCQGLSSSTPRSNPILHEDDEMALALAPSTTDFDDGRGIEGGCWSAESSAECDLISASLDMSCQWAEHPIHLISDGYLASRICPKIIEIVFEGKDEVFGDGAEVICKAYCSADAGLCELADSASKSNPDPDMLYTAWQCKQCRKCLDQPQDFLKYFQQLASQNAASPLSSCEILLHNASLPSGFCEVGGIKGHNPKDMCYTECKLHKHLPKCGLNKSKDACHTQQHCRWSGTTPGELLWWTSDHILQNSYCSDIGALIQVLREGQKSTSDLCADNLECSANHVETVCTILRDNEEMDGLGQPKNIWGVQSMERLWSNNQTLKDLQSLRISSAAWLLERYHSYTKDLDFSMSKFWTSAWKCSMCENCAEGNAALNYIHHLSENTTGDEFVKKCNHDWGLPEYTEGFCNSICDLTPQSCSQFPEFCSCSENMGHEIYCCTANAVDVEFCNAFRDNSSCTSSGCTWVPHLLDISQIKHQIAEAVLEVDESEIRLFNGSESEHTKIESLNKLCDTLWSDMPCRNCNQAVTSNQKDTCISCRSCSESEQTVFLYQTITKADRNMDALETAIENVAEKLGVFMNIKTSGYCIHEGCPATADEHTCIKSGCKYGFCGYVHEEMNEYQEEQHEICNSTCQNSFSEQMDCLLLEESDCIENNACIWEPPGSDYDENELELTMKQSLADDFCPKAARFVSSSTSGGDFTLFESGRVCSIVCEDGHQHSCADILNSALGGGSFKDDSADQTQPTILQFLISYQMCTICRDCEEHPEGFALRIKPYATLAPSAIEEFCREEISTSRGMCKSRCQYIDARECWKEESCHCSTVGNQISDYSAESPQTIPFIQWDSSLSSVSLEESHEIQTDISEEDETYGKPMCENQCMPLYDDGRMCMELNDFESCNKKEQCRWMQDEFDTSLNAHLIPKIHTRVCTGISDLLVWFQSAADVDRMENTTSVCIKSLGCNQETSEFCSTFSSSSADKMENNQQGLRRRLLLRSEASGSDHLLMASGKRAQSARELNVTRIQLDVPMQGVNYSGSKHLPFHRLLLGMSFPSAPSWTKMEASTFFYEKIKCDTCQICEKNSGFMRDFEHWAMQADPEDFLASCLDFPPRSGHCESVCHSIPPDNCHKYSSFCECETPTLMESYCCHRDTGKNCLAIEDEGWCRQTGCQWDSAADICRSTEDENCVDIKSAGKCWETGCQWTLCRDEDKEACNAENPSECWEKGCSWESPGGSYKDMIQKSYNTLAATVCAQLTTDGLDQAAVCDAVCPLGGLTACYNGLQEEEEGKNGKRRLLWRTLSEDHVQPPASAMSYLNWDNIEDDVTLLEEQVLQRILCYECQQCLSQETSEPYIPKLLNYNDGPGDAKLFEKTCQSEIKKLALGNQFGQCTSHEDPDQCKTTSESTCEALGCFWEYPDEYLMSMIDAAYISVAKTICKDLALQDNIGSPVICSNYLCRDSEEACIPSSQLAVESSEVSQLQTSIKCRMCSTCLEGKTEQVQKLIEILELEQENTTKERLCIDALVSHPIYTHFGKCISISPESKTYSQADECGHKSLEECMSMADNCKWTVLSGDPEQGATKSREVDNSVGFCEEKNVKDGVQECCAAVDEGQISDCAYHSKSKGVCEKNNCMWDSQAEENKDENFNYFYRTSKALASKIFTSLVQYHDTMSKEKFARWEEYKEDTCTWINVEATDCSQYHALGDIKSLIKDFKETDNTDKLMEKLDSRARIAAEKDLAEKLCRPLPDNCWMYHYQPDDCSSTPGCSWSICPNGLTLGQALDPWEEEGDIHQEVYKMGEEVCDLWVSKFNILEIAAERQFQGATEFCIETGMMGLEESPHPCRTSINLIVGLVATKHLDRSNAWDFCMKHKGTLGTSQEEMQHLSLLMCNPSDECCKKLDIPSIGEIGIVPTQESCENLDGCAYKEQCLLAKDRCADDFFSSAISGRPVCGIGCTFMESENVRAITTVNGKGFCVDKEGFNICSNDGLRGCKKDECRYKPVCSLEKDLRPTCDGRDKCCIHSRTEKLTRLQKEQCTAGQDNAISCIVHQQCKQIADPCMTFDNELECSKESGCVFMANKNHDNPLIGTCTTQQDPCEQLPVEKCGQAKLHGVQICAAIESCMIDPCRGKHECCGLSPKACKQKSSCYVGTHCMIKPGMDGCSIHMTEGACQIECIWSGGQCITRESSDPCKTFTNGFECMVARPHGRPMCMLAQTCTSLCEQCYRCIQNMMELQGPLVSKTMRQIVNSQCEELGIHPKKCLPFDLDKEALSRPASICKRLNVCSDTCKNPGGKQDEALDLCSPTGYSNGPKNTSFNLNPEGCMEDGNCPSNEYCAYKNSGQICSCDPDTGRNSCISTGSCINRCNQLQGEIRKRNELLNTCNNSDDCEATFSCSTMHIDRCKKLVCDESTGQLSSTQCNGICTPHTRRMMSANFTDSGKSITAALNFPARRSHFVCSDVFDQQTSQKLGAGCRGSTQGKKLLLHLRNEATILPEDELAFQDGQEIIKDIVSGTRFSSKDKEGKLAPVVIGGCFGECVPPSTFVVYPSLISASCSTSNAATGTVLDGTYTRDQSGRPLTCTWSYDSSECHSKGLACTALDAQLENEAARSNPLLELSSETVQDLTSKPGEYFLSLGCENFLGLSSEFSVSLEALGVPVPPVSIVGPLKRKFTVSDGLRIASYVDPDSICPGDTVSYEWSVSGGDELSFTGSQKKDLVLRNIKAIAQKTYPFALRVHLTKPDGTTRSVSKSMVVEAMAVGSDIIPKLSGPDGDVIMTHDLVLAAQCYDPDDPENSNQAFSYEYSCVRSLSKNTRDADETNTEICPYYGIVEGAQVTLSKTNVSLDVWHTYTVTCSKSSTYSNQPAVIRSGSASKNFIARPPQSPIPTGLIKQQCALDKCSVKNNPERPLVLVISDLKYADTDIEWSFAGGTISEADTSSGLTHRVLIIKKNVVEAGSELVCIATLRRVDDAGLIHMGEARITLQMNTGPFCATHNCLSVALATTDNVFPDAKYVLSASNFMDDEDKLEYSFGCLHGNNHKVQQRGPQTRFMLNSLTVGIHTCFGCAIDRHGTHSCEYADLEVLGPIGGVSAEEAIVALDNVEAAKDSGDPVHVLAMVVKAANILQYGTPGRRLLSESQDATEALVNTIAEEVEGLEPFDLTIFQTSLDALASLSASYSLSSANVAMNTAAFGLAATQDELTAIDMGNILTIAAAHSREWTTAEKSSMDIMNEYLRLNRLARDAALLMCDTSLPGEEPRAAAGIDPSMSDGICLKEFSSALSGREFAVGDATVKCPDNLFAESPGNEQLHITATFISNSTVHSALLSGAMNMKINSGVLDISISERDTVCELETCWLLVSIPLHETDSSRETACTRIENGMVVGLTGVDGVWTVPDSYDIQTNSILCNITSLGEVLLVSFPRPAPVAKPPMPLLVQPDPSKVALTPQETENPVQNGGMAPPPDNMEDELPALDRKILIRIKFEDMEYEKLTASSEEAKQNRKQFVTALKVQLSTALYVRDEQLEVTDIVPRVVKLRIHLSAEEAEDVESILRSASSQEQSLFDLDFTGKYGQAEVEIISTTVTPNQGKRSNSGMIAVSIVTTVVGLGIAGVLYHQFRKYRQERQDWLNDFHVI